MLALDWFPNVSINDSSRVMGIICRERCKNWHCLAESNRFLGCTAGLRSLIQAGGNPVPARLVNHRIVSIG
jgi:hypothetical protein